MYNIVQLETDQNQPEYPLRFSIPHPILSSQNCMINKYLPKYYPILSPGHPILSSQN